MAAAGYIKNASLATLNTTGVTTFIGICQANEGLRFGSIGQKRDYIFRMTESAAVSATDDSISIMATGFVAGHFVINTMILVTATVVGNCGALSFNIGTSGECARDGSGATAITGAAIGPGDATDNLTGELITMTTAAADATHSFTTAANNSLAIYAAVGTTAMTDGDITFVATVMSATTAALPAVSTTSVTGHSLS